MNLSYELITNNNEVVGYIIMDEGEPWMVQRDHNPYPADTMAESAQLHIDAIIAENNAESHPNEIDLLTRELADTKQQLAETQDALIELASIIGGVD